MRTNQFIRPLTDWMGFYPQFKILRTIIGSDAIPMVNYLILAKRTL